MGQTASDHCINIQRSKHQQWLRAPNLQADVSSCRMKASLSFMSNRGTETHPNQSTTLVETMKKILKPTFYGFHIIPYLRKYGRQTDLQYGWIQQK
jgi:hypothetical protein